MDACGVILPVPFAAILSSDPAGAEPDEAAGPIGIDGSLRTIAAGTILYFSHDPVVQPGQWPFLFQRDRQRR